MRTKILIMLSALCCVLGLVSPTSAAASTAPTVTSIRPTSGPTTGGTRVTVYGTNFVHVVHVSFGTVLGTAIHVVTPTELLVTAPAHGAGPVDVRVQTASGTSTPVLADHYRFITPPLPKITAVIPARGTVAGGTSVTVYGQNFTSAAIVLFGGRPGTGVQLGNSGTLFVTSPAASAVGVVDVRVQTAAGTSPQVAADAFTYVHGPVTPVSAPAAAFATTTSIGLTWTPSTEGDVTGVMIRRVAGQGAPVSATDGTLVADVPVTQHTVTDTGLARGTTYGYALFAHTADGLLAPRATVQTSTQVTGFSAPVAINPNSGGVNALSCPSPTFCLALDQYGAAAAYNGSSWSSVAGIGGSGGRLLDCVSSTFCLATRNGTALTYDGVSWTTVGALADPARYFSAVSCASAGSCLLVDDRTEVVTLSGGALSAPSAPMGTPAYGGLYYYIGGLSCVSNSFCVAVDGIGRAYYFDGSAWTYQQLNTNGGFGSVSCTSTTRCEALDNAGNEFRYVGASTWKVYQPPLMNVGGENVSCAGASVCAAAPRAGTQVMTLAGSTWTVATLPAHSTGMVISCATATFCAVVDSVGDFFTFDGSGWQQSAVTVLPPHGGLSDVSCVASGFCAAVGGADVVFTGSGGPAAGWGPPQRIAPWDHLSTVSCGSASLCVAVGQLGLYSYDGHGWAGPTVIGAERYLLVSCAGSAFCMATNGNSSVATFDGTQWTESQTPYHPQEISCVSAVYCAALDDYSDQLDVWQNGTWSATPPGSLNASYISCYAVGDCEVLLGSTATSVLDGAIGIQSTLTGLSDTQDISCASAAACIAIGSAGQVVSYNGTSWSAPSPVAISAGDWHDLSCAGPAACVAISHASTEAANAVG